MVLSRLHATSLCEVFEGSMPSASVRSGLAAHNLLTVQHPAKPECRRRVPHRWWFVAEDENATPVNMHIEAKRRGTSVSHP